MPHTRGKESFVILRPSKPKPLIIVLPKVILIIHPITQPLQNPINGDTSMRIIKKIIAPKHPSTAIASSFLL